jgi:hypothetical protein
MVGTQKRKKGYALSRNPLCFLAGGMGFEILEA